MVQGLLSQTFPVTLVPQAVPPAPIYFSSYADISSINSPLRLQIVLNDLSQANREIRLKAYFEGNGIAFESNNVVTGAPSLFIEGGIPLVLSNTELAPYFAFQNITGISPTIYGEAIPEGSYQFCFEVFDALTGAPISQKTCTTTYIFQNEPPLLVNPLNKKDIAEQNPLNLLFQWTPRHINVSNVQYELSIVEIWDQTINPQAAFLASPPFFQTTTTNTTYLYSPADPLLLPNKRYAWRVKAKAINGAEEVGIFKNNGFSEVYWFNYIAPCDTPDTVRHEVKGAQQVNILWDDFTIDVPQFNIRYREKGNNNEWFFSRTTGNWVTIWDLRPGTTYEYQVNKKCLISESEYSIVQEFTTLTEDDETNLVDCGISPDLNIENMEPLEQLFPGNVFKAGDFPVKVTEVSGSNGRFTGKGYVTFPYFKSIKVAVNFTNVFVNNENDLAEGTVITVYDPTWGNILDVDEVIDVAEDIADVFTGGDNTPIDLTYDIDKDDISVTDGQIIITKPDGSTDTFDYDEGDTYTITDASGDTWTVDKDGTISQTGQGDPSPTLTASNADGIRSGDHDGTTEDPYVDKITNDKVTVLFKTGTDTKFALDLANNDYENAKYPKIDAISGDAYYPAHKAAVQAEDDVFYADIEITDAAISIDSIIIKTIKNTAIKHERVSGTNTYKITISGANPYRNEECVVTYKDPTDQKYKIAASFFIHHVKKHTEVPVQVVTVNGGNNIANLEDGLTTIFGVAGGKFKVKPNVIDITITQDSWDTGDKNGIIDYDGSGILSDYPTELKNIYQEFKRQYPGYDSQQYFIFVLGKDLSVSKPLSGFMPKTRQWGFVFESHLGQGLEKKDSALKVAAHEIGHGVYTLGHPFGENTDNAGNATTWLMDYGNGTELGYPNWATMSDPSLKLFLFQDDSGGEYSNAQYFVKTLQLIRCAYINGSNEIPLPDKYKKGGDKVQVAGFDYGLSTDKDKINGQKFRRAWWTVDEKKSLVITDIQNPTIDPNKGVIIFGNFKIRFPVVNYNWNNGVTPFEHLKNYLLPSKEDVKEDYDAVLNELVGKTKFNDGDIRKLKSIASCASKHFSVKNKYIIINKIVNDKVFLTEYYEDLILDLIETYEGDVKIYSEELLSYFADDVRLTRSLFNKMTDENGAYFWKGNEDNFTRFLKVMFGLWKETKFADLTKYEYVEIGDYIGGNYTPISPKTILYDGESWWPDVSYEDVSFRNGKIHIQTKTIRGTYGKIIYDLFQPVLLVFAKGKNNGKATKTEVPAIFFAGTANKDNVEKSLDQIGLTVDVILTFTGVGNFTKLRHLTKLQKIGRIVLGTVEITSGVADILMNYTSICEGSEELCNALREYNMYLQLGLLGSGIIRAKFAAARNKAKNEYLKHRDELIKKHGVEDPKIKELDEHFGIIRNTDGIAKVFFKNVDDFAKTFDKAGEVSEAIRNQAFDLYKQGKWRELETLFKNNNLNGGWPPANGGVNIIDDVTITVGQKFDRYSGNFGMDVNGNPVLGGSFTSPLNKGVPYEFGQRALNKSKIEYDFYYEIEVLQDLPFKAQNADVIPWFGQTGGAKQSMWKMPIDDTTGYPKTWNKLAEEGYIKITIKDSPSGNFSNLTGTVIKN